MEILEKLHKQDKVTSVGCKKFPLKPNLTLSMFESTFTCVCVFLQLGVSLCVFVCDREQRKMTGDMPPDLIGFCGSNVNGTLYIFAGCSSTEFSNEVSWTATNVKVMSSHFHLVFFSSEG